MALFSIIEFSSLFLKNLFVFFVHNLLQIELYFASTFNPSGTNNRRYFTIYFPNSQIKIYIKLSKEARIEII